MISPVPNRFFLVETFSFFNSDFIADLKPANLSLRFVLGAPSVTRNGYNLSLSGLLSFPAHVDSPLLPKEFNK